MTETASSQQLSAFLRTLKERSGRSYEALAKRTGISGSSLHRYCAGTKVPTDFGSLQRFAEVCGASPVELRELHRLWAVADAARTSRQDETAETEEVPEEVAVTHRWRTPVVVAGAVVILVAVALVWTASRQPSARPSVDGPLLLSSACPPVVSMGQHDECVKEVQTLLTDMGAKMKVDGDFGPETLRRVTAFQVLANLQPRGVVDEPTKRALYERKVSLKPWSPDQAEKRIRETFPDVPDRAVGIARCQSFLDPFHILPNTNGTRNWGLFQLSDGLLSEIGGTPRQALTPDWNIETARRVWERTRDFTAWAHCDQPFRVTSTPPSS